MTAHDKPILVTGATGKQGGATARRLLDEGRAVRAMVRDPASAAARALAEAGAALVRADFDRPETLADAVAGVGGVFAVPPAAFRPDGWDVDLEAERGERLIEAARGAGVEHVVFTSIATTTGPTIPGTAGKERIEAALRGSGMRHTVLRPVRFMENYLFTDTPVDGIHGGVHRHLFRADRPMQVIAVADIAVFAALAFADPDRYDGETLELAGDAPTPVEAAAAVGAAIGAEVRYERVTAEEAKALGEEIVQTWELHEAGHAWKADIPALRRLHPGLRTLEDWLAEGGADAIGRR